MELEIRIEKAKRKRVTILAIILGLIISSAILFFKKSIQFSFIGFIVIVAVILVFYNVRLKLQKTSRINKIENVFPDFLQLISSNLRAGMTIDKAILISARSEFTPLDKEVLQAGREIATGKPTEIALKEMSKRIGSEKIDKIVTLINSGIRSGGNLAILLDETSSNMRQREIVLKKAASNVLMYVIFIFLIVSLFAPALFALSTVLVEVLTSILSGLPATESSTALPFTLSKIDVSVKFITYFSLLFIVVIGFLASLVIGLVSKGEEKQGLRYVPAMLTISVSVFIITKFLVSRFISGFI